MNNCETVNYVVELLDGRQMISKFKDVDLPEVLQAAVEGYEQLSVEGRLLE